MGDGPNEAWPQAAGRPLVYPGVVARGAGLVGRGLYPRGGVLAVFAHDVCAQADPGIDSSGLDCCSGTGDL